MSVHSVLVGIRVSKCSLGRPRLRWVDNIRMDLWVRIVYMVLLGNRRERAHWGDLGIDVWIILGWICRRWDVGIWIGLCWPRIGTYGGRL